MRGDVGNSNFYTFNKNYKGLISWSFESPHSAYSSRCASLNNKFDCQINRVHLQHFSYRRTICNNR